MTILTKNTDILRAEVSKHLAADALIRGTYWDVIAGKGCFIGCLTHSNDPAPAFERFGLPVAVMRIAENIFEALSIDEGRAFFAALPDAVGCDGKDLSRVVWAFLAEELRALPKQEDTVQAVIGPVIKGMEILASGCVWDAAEAAYAARAAAYASRAAYAAAYAAYAAADADAAYASRAAYAAAYAAYAAADADAAHIRQRDTLLRLIANAEVIA